MDEIRPRANTKELRSLSPNTFSRLVHENFAEQEIREEPPQNSRYTVTLCEIKYLGYHIYVIGIEDPRYGYQENGHPLKHTFLPALPMRMLVVAPSNGGKSNLLKNMLLRPEFGYRDYFTDPKTALNYFVFSRTLGADHTLDSFVDQLPKFHAYRDGMTR